MFSRNIFYAFDSNAEFSKDAFSAKKWRHNQNEFDSLADELLELYKRLEEIVYLEKTIVFEWSDSHQEILVSKFDTWAKQHEQIFGKESKRLFFRLALITTRLATIFSVLRKNEQDGLLSILQDDSNETVINCSNEDFEIALHVTDIIRQHNFFVYENLPDNGKAIYESYTSNSRLNELLIALPKEFKREDVLHLMDEISVSKRTFDNYLKNLLQLGLIEKKNRRFGHYVKTDVAKL